MLKQSILIISTALFLVFVPLKMPTFEMPSFLSFSKDSTKRFRGSKCLSKN